jgi:hypothetical protein
MSAFRTKRAISHTFVLVGHLRVTSFRLRARWGNSGWEPVAEWSWQSQDLSFLVPGLWCLVFGVWSLVSGSGDQMPHNIVCKSQPRQTLSWTRARLSQTGSGCCLIFTWAHRPSPAGPGPATRPAQSAQAASQPRSQPGPARPGQPARQVGQPAQPGSPHCPRMQRTRRATQPATQYLQRVAKDFVETLCKY